MHKISKDVKKWVLDKSKLSKEDKEVLEIVRFPQALGYRQCAQKRITKMSTHGGFVNKQILDINDIKYVSTLKTVAEYDIARHSPSGNTPEQMKRSEEFLSGILKSKARQLVYIDGNYMDEELEWVLSTFSVPKPTPSMKPAVKPKTKLPKKIKTLTKEQKKISKEKFLSGEMDLKELSTHLKVSQALLKPYLKTLNEQ